MKRRTQIISFLMKTDFHSFTKLGHTIENHFLYFAGSNMELCKEKL